MRKVQVPLKVFMILLIGKFAFSWLRNAVFTKKYCLYSVSVYNTLFLKLR